MARKVVIFGGSFNPPCSHHQAITRILLGRFDEVIIVPCGARKDKSSVNIVEPRHRAAMALLAFGNLPNVLVDLFDLQNNSFTPTLFLQERYQKLFPGTEIWHAVGGDIISGGKEGKSEIHRVWHEGEKIWKSLQYAVIKRPDCIFIEEDMPPYAEFIDGMAGSSTIVREYIHSGLSTDGLVDPKVKVYIEQEKLYK